MIIGRKPIVRKMSAYSKPIRDLNREYYVDGDIMNPRIDEETDSVVMDLLNTEIHVYDEDADGFDRRGIKVGNGGKICIEDIDPFYQDLTGNYQCLNGHHSTEIDFDEEMSYSGDFIMRFGTCGIFEAFLDATTIDDFNPEMFEEYSIDNERTIDFKIGINVTFLDGSEDEVFYPVDVANYLVPNTALMLALKEAVRRDYGY